MKITKTCALWNEHRRLFKKADEEMDACIRAEFPPGTRVSWVYTYDNKTREPIKREGVVSDFYGYGKVNVQMKVGGPKHCLQAYQLDIITSAEVVTGKKSR